MRLILVLIVLLASCSPQKRVTNILKKNPELLDTFTNIKVDTIIRTRIIPEKRDSLIIKHDTIIQKEEYILEKKGDSIFITIPQKKIFDTTFNYKLITLKDSIINDLKSKYQKLDNEAKKLKERKKEDKPNFLERFLGYLSPTLLLFMFIIYVFIIRKRK
jgi:hypothetical protein